MIEIFKEFTFDAAHHLGANTGKDHPYARMHGHSFKAEVYLRGTPDAKTGWLMDLGELDRTIGIVREKLDHRYLNDIAGLELPTLENLARWIWRELKPALPLLCRIVIRRGSHGEGCIYEE